MSDWSGHSIRVRALELALERAKGNVLEEGQIMKDAKEYEEFILGKKGDGGDGK